MVRASLFSILFRYQAVALLIFLTVVGLSRRSDAGVLQSPYLGQIAALAPRDSQEQDVSPNSELAQRMDRLTLQILATPTGKAFCGAVIEQPLFIQRAFFIHEDSVRKASRLCQGRFARKMGIVPFQKQFYVLVTDQEKFPANGWTTPRNETVFIVNRAEYTEARLLQSLIHEMTVSFDLKEQVGNNGILDSSRGLGLVTTPESCSSIQLIRNGKLKHALTTIRAFEMEKKISEELGLRLPENFANWQHWNCTQKLEFIGPYIDRLGLATAPESLVNLFMDIPSCGAKPTAATTYSERIKALAEINFTFHDGTTRNACEFLTEGIPFSAGVSFRGGPGPRIGGAGWDKSP